MTFLRNAFGDWTRFDPAGIAAATLLAGGGAMLAVRFLPGLSGCSRAIT